MWRNGPKILAAQTHDATCFREAHDGAYCRGLASAIAPDECGSRAGLQGEADIAQHRRTGYRDVDVLKAQHRHHIPITLSLIHISEPTRLGMISYAVFCLKKKKK